MTTRIRPTVADPAGPKRAAARRHSARAWKGVAVAGLLLTGCGSDDASIAGAERSLAGGFLDALDEADLDYEMLATCHYDRPPDGAWHLAVHLLVSADVDEVATTLAGSIDIVTDDRPTARVQQHHGRPNHGWTGQLTAMGPVTTLDLVKNNVDIDNRPALARLPVCAESRPA